MTNFDESKHPRAAGGQFTEKTHSDPTIDLVSMNALTVAPSAAGPFAYTLAEGGLTGTVTQYEGDNPDVPVGALTYRHALSQYELALYEDEDEGFTVRYDDRYDESNSFTVSTESTEPEERVAAVHGALYDLDVAEKAYAIFEGETDDFERREVDLRKLADGSLQASIVLSGHEPEIDEDGEEGDVPWLTVTHNYTKSETSIFDDNKRKYLSGMDLKGMLDKISAGLAPGDRSTGMAESFENLLDRVRSTPFAPEDIKSRGSW